MRENESNLYKIWLRTVYPDTGKSTIILTYSDKTLTSVPDKIIHVTVLSLEALR